MSHRDGAHTHEYTGSQAIATDIEKLVLKLIRKGASVHARTERGNTPLHFAAVKGHIGIVKLLVKYKANPNSQNSEGLTPLHYAAMYDNFRAAEVLILKGAKRNLKDGGGRTPLDCAITPKMKELLE